jgi:O-antigen/teichoic acid export membrane protein
VADTSVPTPPVARGAAVQSLSRGAVLVTIASGVFMVSGYVVNVWLGRLLGPAEYGTFSVVIGLLTLLNVIQNAAVPQAVARVAAQAPDQADGTLRRGAELQLTIAVAMAVALAIGAPAIGALLGDDDLVGLLWVAAVVLPPYGLFTLLMAFHGGRRRYSHQAWTLTAYAVAKAVAAIALAYAYRLWGAVAGYLIAAGVGVAAGWHRLSAARSAVSSASLIGFALPLSIFAIATVGLMSVDILFVKALISGDEAAGHYGAGQNVARIPYYLMTGLAAIILPAIAGSATRGPLAAAATARQALRWALIAVVPLTAVIVATRAGLVELLYSTEYRPAGEVLLVLGPAMGALALGSIGAGVLSGLGHARTSAAMAVTGLVVTVAACALLVPPAGSLGAALATLIGAASSTLGITAALWRISPTALPVASTLRVLVAAAIGAGAAWITAPTGIGLVVAFLGIGAIVAAILVVTREVTVDELRRLAGRTRAVAAEVGHSASTPES